MRNDKYNFITTKDVYERILAKWYLLATSIDDTSNGEPIYTNKFLKCFPRYVKFILTKEKLPNILFSNEKDQKVVENAGILSLIAFMIDGDYLVTDKNILKQDLSEDEILKSLKKAKRYMSVRNKIKNPLIKEFFSRKDVREVYSRIFKSPTIQTYYMLCTTDFKDINKVLVAWEKHRSTLQRDGADTKANAGYLRKSFNAKRRYGIETETAVRINNFKVPEMSNNLTLENLYYAQNLFDSVKNDKFYDIPSVQDLIERVLDSLLMRKYFFKVSVGID